MTFIDNYLFTFITNYYNFLLNIDQNLLITICLLSSTFLLCFPLPGSIWLAINVSLFGYLGLLITYISALTSALLIFFIARNFHFNFITKYIHKLNFRNDLLYLTLLRIVIPFPICSYLLNFFKVKLSNYILCTAIGFFPGAIPITIIFANVKNIVLEYQQKDLNLYKKPEFLIGLIFVILLVFVIKILKKKYKF